MKKKVKKKVLSEKKNKVLIMFFITYEIPLRPNPIADFFLSDQIPLIFQYFHFFIFFIIHKKL